MFPPWQFKSSCAELFNGGLTTKDAIEHFIAWFIKAVVIDWALMSSNYEIVGSKKSLEAVPHRSA